MTDVQIQMGENFQELAVHGSREFPIQYYADELFRFPGGQFPLHWHGETELFLALGGPVQAQIGRMELCLNEGDWNAVRKDIDLRPVSVMCDGEKFIVDGKSEEKDILEVLEHYGITKDAVTLWGTGTPMREFLWSEEMADASVHVLLNVNFRDTYDASVKNADGIAEIRNCHINVGTGKELSIREVAEKIMSEIGFKGELRWDRSKPDGTMRKLTDVTKLHRLYEWYLKGICINHKTV